MPRKKYTDAEKIAYYKAKARAAEGKGTTTRKRTTTTRKARAPRRSAYSKSKRDYYTDGEFGEMVGGGIGAFFGGAPGALAGASIGRGAHKLFKSLTGWGDYKVCENSLMMGGMSPPQIINSSDRGGFIVRHREYLRDVLSTEDFTLQAFDINPGLSQSFPWLSGVAENFEEYRMRGLVYEFKSLSSDAVLSTASSSALGAVIMATSYNVLNPSFANKMEMENYEYANSSKPSLSFLHPIECKRTWTPVSELFTRVNGVPSGGDQRLYDLGKFQIATVGQQVDGGVIGELWCTYEVELYKPKVGEEDAVMADAFDFTGTIDGAAPFGEAEVRHPGSNLLGSIQRTVSRCIYQFPSGLQVGSRFLVNYVIVGSANVTLVPPTFGVQNLEILNFYSGGGQNITFTPESGATTTAFTLTCVVNVLDEDESDPRQLRFGVSGTLPNGLTVCSLAVTALPDDMSQNPSPTPVIKNKKPRQVRKVTTTSIEELEESG